MKTNVLVTGATGFVGSHVLEALQARDDLHVIAACRDRKSLPAGFEGEVREGDLRDPQYLQEVVQGVDVLCHAAAWSALWGAAEESRRRFLAPTLALIEAASGAGVRRFVNTSTTSAAAPERSRDPMSRGIPRPYWPHLACIVAIEDALKERTGPAFQVVNLRLGTFVGRRYALGILPVLVPRLKTHMVPWVAGGSTSLPLTDGRDIGQAFMRAATAQDLAPYESFNIVGAEVPTVREVLAFLHEEYGLPMPHFDVPFPVAYAVAWLMERMAPFVPWEPLVTRSIIHLMEEVNADNTRAERLLGYRPVHEWKESVRMQMEDMRERETRPMRLHRPMA